jgi:hypothetical protein
MRTTGSHVIQTEALRQQKRQGVTHSRHPRRHRISNLTSEAPLHPRLPQNKVAGCGILASGHPAIYDLCTKRLEACLPVHGAGVRRG